MKWKLLILLLHFSAVYSPPLPDRSVTAEEGETVILPVKVDLPEDSELLLPIINWKTERGGIVHDYWYDQDNNEFQDERFKNRTSLFEEEIKKGNVSLKIRNVTKNDTGKYTCEVHLFKGDKSYKVYLWVLEISGRRGPTESPEPEQPVLTSGQIIGIVVGVLLVLAALTGVTVFLYIKRKATKRRYRRAKADNLAMETLKGGQELVQSSEDPTSICAQQQNEENTNNELLDC